MIRLGAALCRRRAQRGMTARAISEMAKVSPSYLSEIEAGAANPSWDVLDRIAKALGTKLSVVIQETE